ncbi:MAG: S9 family peptidase [Planctomycetota bacterium]|jgi:dipeptidyl aminopeptidase/acylaminoacyl peptidase
MTSLRDSARCLTILLLAAVAAVAAAPAAAASDAPGPAGDPVIARFMKIRAPGQPTLGPDGALYVVDWPDGINRLYVRRNGLALDEPFVRLTDFEDGINGYALSPDGRTIIVSAATGGSEQDDLHRLDPATGEITPLRADPGVVYGFQRWTADSAAFYYTANDDSPSDFHVYRYDLASGASTKLLAQPGWWMVTDATDDGGRLLVARYISASVARAYELDTATGELTNHDIGAETFNWPGVYLPGERAFTLASDHEEGIPRLFVRDLAGGAATKPLPALDAYPFEQAAVSEDRGLGAFLFNEGGYRTLHLVALPGFERVDLPPVEEGIVGDVDLRGTTLTWTISNARRPGLAHAWDVRGGSAPARLTVADDQGIDLEAFTLPRLVSFKSFDGLEIPAFLYTPPGHEPGTPIPFIVHFHGGPEGQHRPWFSRTVQYLLGRGFGILQPNVRGSTGYGREFHRLDDYRARWDSVRDGAEAARWLVGAGYARPGEIAAFGGSYGGFMAVATVIEGPDVFGAAIDVVGIVNFKTFLEQTKDYRRKLREVEYGPLSDPEFLESVSPLRRADEIEVPMLIAQLYFPDEGHGFAKLDNRLLFYERMARFLEAHLAGSAEPATRRGPAARDDASRHEPARADPR